MSPADPTPRGAWEAREDQNELQAIRHELDDLVRRRFDHGWTDPEGAAFERLAARELELLDELAEGRDVGSPQVPPSPM
jgi:hypothetical protein